MSLELRIDTQTGTGRVSTISTMSTMEGQGPRVVLMDALQALYHHPEAQIRTAANRWLDDFQHTMEAWQISDSILHDPNSNLEALYFCAQTLRTKVQRDFEDLPPNAFLSLRNSVMTLLVKFRQGPPPVRTQLCLAMVALAVQMPPGDWGNGGVVQWLGNELSSQSDAVYCLLELVTVLPQETQSFKIAVKPERRRQFHRELVSAVQDAFNLLSSFLNEGDMHLREQILRSFAAWMRLSYGVPASTLATHPLVGAALDGLDTQQTFDAAKDAVTELIRYTVSGNPVDLAVHMPLVQVLVPKIMSLRPRFSAAVKVAYAEKQSQQGSELESIELEEDDDTIKGVAYLFTEIGESYVDLIASGSSESLMIVEALVEVTSHPDDNIASITFYFWHKLSKVLTGQSNSREIFEGEAALNAEREKRLVIFQPTFKLLVSLVSFRVMYPPGFESWRRDELSDFRETRHAVADVLVDVASVLGGEATLEILASPLLQIHSLFQVGLPWDWRSAEAHLYCVRAIAKAIPPLEDNVLPQVMALLPKLPLVPQLLYTSSLTIAAVSDWLGAAASGPRLLPSLVGLLITAICSQEEAYSAGALALKHVCDACRKELGKSIEDLLEVYRRVISGEEKLRLTAEDELQVVEGLSMVVSDLPLDRLPQALEALCIPILVPLEKIVTDAQQPGFSQSLTSHQYTVYIDRIANIFRYVNQPELMAGVFQRMWPLLKAVFSQRAGDVRTMEKLCRACKYAVRNCGRALGGMLGLLLQEVQELFLQQKHSCLLYLASEMIKVFGSDAACAGYLGTLITVLFGATVGLLQNIQDFTSHPDVADDCFVLASRCIRYCPQLLVPTPVLIPLFRCAMTGATIQHREACCSILQFFQDLLELPLSPAGKQFRTYVDAAILQCGSTLTRVIIGALVGGLPESRFEELSQVLLCLARLYGQQLTQWTQEVLALIPPSVVTEPERTGFLQSIDSPSAFVRSMEELSDVCRRKKKVQEIVQNSLQPSRLSL